MPGTWIENPVTSDRLYSHNRRTSSIYGDVGENPMTTDPTFTTKHTYREYVRN
jgi:hypothetical protein